MHQLVEHAPYPGGMQTILRPIAKGYFESLDSIQLLSSTNETIMGILLVGGLRSSDN